MRGPQSRLCLFTYQTIALKQLNGLTTIDPFNWLGGPEATHLTGVRELPVSIPDSGNGSFVWILFCCCFIDTFLSKTHYLSRNFVIHLEMLIPLVYWTYCKICDRLQGYQDTDLAPYIPI